MLTNKQTNKETNDDENITFLAGVIKGFCDDSVY